MKWPLSEPIESTCVLHLFSAQRTRLLLTLPLLSMIFLFVTACGESAPQSKTGESPNAAARSSSSRPEQAPPPPPPQAIEVDEPASRVVNYGYEVVQSYSHDPQAYTQGLQFIDGELFESTGQHGRSSLRRVLLESGSVVQSRELSMRYFGEGMTVVGDRIYMITWQSGTAFVFDRTTFEPLDTLHYRGEGWGLTWDGTDLIMSNGSSRIDFRDPEDFSVKRSIQVVSEGEPVPNLNELEFIDGEIWANIYLTNSIVRINPLNGNVTGLINLHDLLSPADNALGSAEVLNGIAWDAEGERLFVTGKNWPKLFHIRLTKQ